MLDSDQRVSLFTMGVALIFVIIWCLVSPPHITWAEPPDDWTATAILGMDEWDVITTEIDIIHDDSTVIDFDLWPPAHDEGDTTLYYNFVIPFLKPYSDSLVIFYVDTVAWKQAKKTVQTPCFLDDRDGSGTYNLIGCAVWHYKEIEYWTPIVETTVVATYLVSSKVKRDRWQWRVR